EPALHRVGALRRDVVARPPGDEVVEGPIEAGAIVERPLLVELRPGGRLERRVGLGERRVVGLEGLLPDREEDALLHRQHPVLVHEVPLPRVALGEQPHHAAGQGEDDDRDDGGLPARGLREAALFLGHAAHPLTTPMYGRFRSRPSQSSPYPTTNSSGMLKPLYSMGIFTLARAGFSSSAHTFTDSGERVPRLSSR